MASAALAEEPAVVEADRAVLEEGLLTLEGGALVRPDGLILRFEQGRMRLDRPDHLELEGALLTTCGPCARPPWQVSARHAVVDLGDEVVVRGGVVRLFGVPLLPVPRLRVPLGRRSGLLPPELGWGVDGPRASLPLYLTLGEQADTTLAPELRWERGARLLSELRWATHAGQGEVDGALGYDWAEARPRGAVGWRQRAEQGRLRAATRGQLVGDATYLVDYQDDYLSRSWPWTGARGAAGAGPVELGWVLAQADETRSLPGWEQWSAGVYRGGIALPGGGIALGRVAGTAERWGPWEGAELRLSGQGHLEVARPTWVGPLRLSPELVVHGVARTHPDPEDAPPLLGLGRVALEAALPAWHRTEAGLETVEPTLRAAALVPTWGEERAEVGAGLRWRRVGEGRLVELRPEVVLEAEGLGVAADAALRWKGLTGWAEVRAREAGVSSGLASLDWTHGPLRLGGGWVFLDPVQLPGEAPTALSQARGRVGLTLPGRLAPLDLSVETRWDGHDRAWLSQVGRLQWTHPTGCARVGLTLRLDADRAWPDLGLELRLR